MTGLEKITGRITDEAEAQAAGVISDAEAKAAEIKTGVMAKAESECAEISARSEAEVRNYMDRVSSGADLQRRKAVLKAKQEVIASVIEKAYSSLLSLDDKEYFEFLTAMLHKYVLADNGTICFSERDLQRMPHSFKKSIAAVAKENGGSLEISSESRSIEGGFVLIYGGVEENCSFKALFSAKQDSLQDKVHGLLFA